jgi:hypothetical protein
MIKSQVSKIAQDRQDQMKDKQPPTQTNSANPSGQANPNEANTPTFSGIGSGTRPPAPYQTTPQYPASFNQTPSMQDHVSGLQTRFPNPGLPNLPNLNFGQ